MSTKITQATITTVLVSCLGIAIVDTNFRTPFVTIACSGVTALANLATKEPSNDSKPKDKGKDKEDKGDKPHK
jgi:predicted MFS family arabinose efflux permease